MMALDALFSMFKWYRKRSGGTWYLVTDNEQGSGIAGPARFWIRAKDADSYKDYEVLTSEKFK